VLQAIAITREVIGYQSYRAVLSEAEEYVQKGEPLSLAFVNHPKLYPILVGDMIAVGEETGAVAKMLREIAVMYEAEVEQKTKDLSTVIEPLLMLFIGGVVGIFALSMIAPIYSITENIQ
jgi:type IV pilus assembly protein PilC